MNVTDAIPVSRTITQVNFDLVITEVPTQTVITAAQELQSTSVVKPEPLE